MLSEKYGCVQLPPVVRALDAARDWRGALLFAVPGTIALWLLAAFGYASFCLAGHAHEILGGLLLFAGSLLSAAALLAGVGACGARFLAEAAGNALPSVREALILGKRALPRVAGFLLFEAMAFIGLVAVGALALLFCAIPFVGPLLYLLALPVTALSVGLAAFALTALVNPLMLPALLDNDDAGAALRQLRDIARARFMPTLAEELLLALLLAAATGGVCVVFGGGMRFATVLSAAVIGNQAAAGAPAILGTIFHAAGSKMAAGGSGYLVARAFDLAAYMIAALTWPILIAIKGGCLIYVRHRTETGTAEAKPVAVGAPAGEDAALLSYPAPTDSAVSPQCPHCQNPIAADDVFCCQCGVRIRSAWEQ